MDDHPRVTLRPFRADDLALRERFCVDPDVLGAYQWHGFSDAHEFQLRWAEDTFLTRSPAEGRHPGAPPRGHDRTRQPGRAERAGALRFRREGVIRAEAFRRGAWQDSVLYGLLRTDDRGA